VINEEVGNSLLAVKMDDLKKLRRSFSLQYFGFVGKIQDLKF